MMKANSHSLIPNLLYIKSIYFKSIAAAVAVLSACVLYISCNSVNGSLVSADAFVKLRDARKVAVSPEGIKAVITSWDNSVIVSRSITYNGLTRFAMGSGNVEVQLNSQMVTGTLDVGYLIGCQFDITGATLTFLVTGNIGQYVMTFYPTPSIFGGPSGYLGLQANVSVNPGIVNFRSIVSQPITKGSAVVQFQNFQIPATASPGSGEDAVCAGYAQARLFAQIQVDGVKYKLISSLYGQPFGIG